jgi:hypothetical protein
MAVEAARLRRGGRTPGTKDSGRGGRNRRGEGGGAGGIGAALLRLPGRWLLLGVVALALLVAGGGALFYRSLDSLYPQEIWKYFRPQSPVGSGSVLFRTQDGQLLVAPVADAGQSRRLLDAAAVAAGASEFVRDAVALPGSAAAPGAPVTVAYYATERRSGRPESDRVKLMRSDGTLVRDLDVSAAAGEALRPALYVSAGGRYLALTSRDRSRVFYLDTTAPDGALVAGQVDTPPERMLWNRNGDLQTPLLASQRPFASSPDGKLRAQVREGKRRSPECGEQKCEAVQEVVISSGVIAGPDREPRVLYGAFSQFSADGWGPIPPQPAQKLYGRLVWSPDGAQVLFSTLDGAETRTYAIGVDGKTQPRLVLEDGEALDWLP